MFQLQANKASVKTEIIAGITTFLTMMYILFANGAILADAGMPVQGVFIATALSASVGTLIVCLFANVPFAMAPGMGLNSMFVHTICLGAGYHWKEALAITFLAGIVHAVVMFSPFRKSFVDAIPESLRIASGAGLGLFIAYIGLDNAGFLSFTISPGQYRILSDHRVVTDTNIIPGFLASFGSKQLVAIAATIIMLFLLSREKIGKEWFGALPISILAATFIGLPMNAPLLQNKTIVLSDAFAEFVQISFSFFGSPGLGSIFSDTRTSLHTLLLIMLISMTSMLDSVGTMIGIGHVEGYEIFDEEDDVRFKMAEMTSKQDRTLLSNAIGDCIAPLFGSSPSAVYLESVTGVVSGGRTGLTGLVVSLMFILCIPAAAFFSIIPIEAVSPVIFYAGMSMMVRVRQINWRDFDEAIPAFLVILIVPTSYSIIDGFCVGLICHLAISIAMGKKKQVHPILVIICLIYVLLKVGGTML